jgi:hypothetical protein
MANDTAAMTDGIGPAICRRALNRAGLRDRAHRRRWRRNGRAANGFAHSLDYDNHHAKGVIHAGSSVVNAAPPPARERPSGKERIAAVVIGYETPRRLAMAPAPRHEMVSRPAPAPPLPLPPSSVA